MSDKFRNQVFGNGWKSVSPSGRTEVSKQRQRALYEQHVRNGNDAVRNNPNQW